MRFCLYRALTVLTVLYRVTDASALDCPSVKDLHTDSTNYLTSNGFPKRGSTKQDCTFTLKLNYGSYVKVLPEVVDIPCGGGNGIRFYDRIEVGPIDKGSQVPSGNFAPRKPTEFQSPLYCGKNVRIPAFVSTNVEMLIHYKAPPGSRMKIGYKAVRASKGPKVPRIASKRDDAVQELNKWKTQLKKMQSEKIANYASGGGRKPENGPKENWSVSAPEWKPPGNNPVQLKNSNRPGQNAYDYQPANNNFGARYNYNYNYNSYGGPRQGANRGGFGRQNEPNLNNHGPYEPKEDYGIYDFESFDEKEASKSGLGGSTKAALVILFLLVISGGSLVYYNERYIPEKARKQEEALNYLQKRHSNPTSTNATGPVQSTVATTARTEATDDQDPPPSFEEIETEAESTPNKPN